MSPSTSLAVAGYGFKIRQSSKNRMAKMGLKTIANCSATGEIWLFTRSKQKN
jgi:hypothetical protein